MKTIVEALQDLYVAMGGSASDVSNMTLNPDVIEQIASLVSSGETKELPAVTAADNDKVLAVVNGAWDKAEASGGGGAFVVELSGYPIITETTYAEVVAAISAEKTVYIHHIDYLGGYYIPVSYYLSHDGDDDYVQIQGEWFELSPEDDGSGGEKLYRINYCLNVYLTPNAENNRIEFLRMKFEIVEN